jgi:KDO2-lipid IV(A) lauroyltransferase
MPPPLYQLRAFQAARAIARLLPRPALQRIAPAIGRAASARNATAHEALRENLRAITGCDADELDRLCRENVAHFSRMLADYFFIASGAPTRAQSLLAEWRGIEHFERAREAGRGVVLVTAHLGNWELGGVLLALRGLPMTVVTLEEPTTELTLWRDQLRQRLGIRTIAVGPGHDFALVEMLQILRHNEVLAMLVDRPYAGSGVPVTFFGRQTEFSSAPALLHRHSGAAIVPAFVLQGATGRYISFADAPLAFRDEAAPRAALATNTQILATHFEAVIRQHPEQWFNFVPIWRNERPELRPPAA